MPPAEINDQPMAYGNSIPRAVTYTALSHAAGLVLYGVMLGGAAIYAPVFVAASLGTAVTLYFVHDAIWQFAQPLPEPVAHLSQPLNDVTWRVAGTARSFVIGLAFAGSPAAAAGYAVASSAADGAIQMVNDHVWRVLAPSGAYRPR